MKFLLGLSAVALMVASACLIFLIADPEPDRPPHRERPTAGVAIAPPSLAAVGGDSTTAVETQVRDFVQGVLDEQERAAEREAALADLARQRPVRSGVGFVGGGDCAALAAELGLSEAILWRESRCSTDAYNATGCSGRGCLGAAQLDAGHFAPVSPWNSGASGSCADLNPSIPSEYAECVSRLPASAWG